ncbi:MAG: 4'-phosphopantetheinyl transferase superfamily protein [Bdellovibrionales bacterium]|nr:4'-phosphopantetheinyl transferase superfamily protein [Bdellovibrionales bacterium]
MSNSTATPPRRRFDSTANTVTESSRTFPNPIPLKEFITPLYHGAWFRFEGDRFSLRNEIAMFLRNELKDQTGALSVGEFGPEWIGNARIKVSYSHSGDFAVMVWTSTHQIGVDLEPVGREYSHPPLELAKRFFHENEVRSLEDLVADPDRLSSTFRDFWLKKEAYGKLTREGLKGSVHLDSLSIPNVRFETLPVIPEGYDARIAIR